MARALTVALALALLLLSAATPAADASGRQISIMQDDAAFLGLSPHNPDAAMSEAKALGVDVVRTFVVWNSVSPQPQSPTRPKGFDVGDPNSPGYNWKVYDDFVDRARRHGLKVFLTLTLPMPHWASEEPSACPHRIGGYDFLQLSCMWKPDPVIFGQFAQAVARRYGAGSQGPHGGTVALYSLWNEPNLEHYLFPQTATVSGRRVDVAAKRYRELWLEGWKAIAISDPARRDDVLFGETAAISSPIDTLYAALCMDPNGRPFRGPIKRLQGCMAPHMLPIGGVATHPYNDHAGGTPFSASFSNDSIAPAYVSRLHRLMQRAARLGRIPSGRGVYMTESGFQSNPPDVAYGLPLGRHAAAINEAERLFFGDPRVKSIAQFELYDVPALPRESPAQDVYTTGLRFVDGRPKPALEAFRIPLVVTRLGPGLVEVWGQARPAPGATTITITASPRRGEPYQRLQRVRTNRAGYFRVRLPRPDAERLRYRLAWRSPEGVVMRSRRATAGPRLRYLEPVELPRPPASPTKPTAPTAKPTEPPAKPRPPAKPTKPTKRPAKPTKPPAKAPKRPAKAPKPPATR